MDAVDAIRERPYPGNHHRMPLPPLFARARQQEELPLILA